MKGQNYKMVSLWTFVHQLKTIVHPPDRPNHDLYLCYWQKYAMNYMKCSKHNLIV